MPCEVGWNVTDGIEIKENLDPKLTPKMAFPASVLPQDIVACSYSRVFTFSCSSCLNTPSRYVQADPLKTLSTSPQCGTSRQFPRNVARSAPYFGTQFWGVAVMAWPR